MAMSPLDETDIETAGVMRCCLATVAEEYIGKRVALGATSKCRHCNTAFTLVAGTTYPKWKPDWQIKHDDQRKHT